MVDTPKGGASVRAALEKREDYTCRNLMKLNKGSKQSVALRHDNSLVRQKLGSDWSSRGPAERHSEVPVNAKLTMNPQYAFIMNETNGVLSQIRSLISKLKEVIISLFDAGEATPEL